MELCVHCAGSGEGMVDGSRCRSCRGTGEVPSWEDDDEQIREYEND